MKRILLLILMIILSLGTVQARASEISQNEKQILPVLIVNNSYSSTDESMAKMKAELPAILMDQITKSLGDKYNIKQLNNDYNIHDVASTEKSDLLDAFKETNYPMVVLVEILPIDPGARNVHKLVGLHFKIFNIKDNKYLYNGKLWTGRTNGYYGLRDLKPQIDILLKDVFKM